MDGNINNVIYMIDYATLGWK